MQALLLLLITPASIASITGEIHYWSNLISLYRQNKLFVEANSDNYADTSCNIAVGVITAVGGFGCVIYGGIAKGEAKSCVPGQQEPIKFDIYIADPKQIGVFVATERGCADGLHVYRVYMDPGFGSNPGTDYSWIFNRWIKDSTGNGLVFQWQHGQIEQVDSNVDLRVFSGSMVSPPDFHDAVEYVKHDSDDWRIINFNESVLISSVILNILFIFILIWCWRQNNKLKNKMSFHVIKGNSTSDEDEDED